MKNRYDFFKSLLVTLSISAFFLLSANAANAPLTDEALEAWFRSDEIKPDPLLLINEGDLVFLSQPPERKPHQAQHSITVLPDSLDHGWVLLHQCHENLDVMPKVQVVFEGKRVRNLEIVSSKHIDKVWVEQDTVQMKSVRQGAQLCLQVETQILSQDQHGRYRLHTGPYQRRFLDGYFPVNLQLDIRFPKELLTYTSILPLAQPGLTVAEEKGALKINALFEGKLRMDVQFSKR